MSTNDAVKNDNKGRAVKVSRVDKTTNLETVKNFSSSCNFTIEEVREFRLKSEWFSGHSGCYGSYAAMSTPDVAARLKQFVDY